MCWHFLSELQTQEEMCSHTFMVNKHFVIVPWSVLTCFRVDPVSSLGCCQVVAERAWGLSVTFPFLVLNLTAQEQWLP